MQVLYHPDCDANFRCLYGAEFPSPPGARSTPNSTHHGVTFDQAEGSVSWSLLHPSAFPAWLLSVLELINHANPRASNGMHPGACAADPNSNPRNSVRLTNPELRQQQS
jgi:hypothetical protein